MKISSLSIERLKRVSKNINSSSVDKGFRSFKLTNSNFKNWKNYEGKDNAEIEKLFKQNIELLVNEWSILDILTEILLIEGFTLDFTIEKINTEFNILYKISCDYLETELIICLDNRIETKTIDKLKFNESLIFICLDSAITDQEKINLTDKGLVKTM